MHRRGWYRCGRPGGFAGTIHVEPEGVTFYHPGGQLGYYISPRYIEENVHSGWWVKYHEDLTEGLAVAEGL